MDFCKKKISCSGVNKFIIGIGCLYNQTSREISGKKQ